MIDLMQLPSSQGEGLNHGQRNGSVLKIKQALVVLTAEHERLREGYSVLAEEISNYCAKLDSQEPASWNASRESTNEIGLALKPSVPANPGDTEFDENVGAAAAPESHKDSAVSSCPPDQGEASAAEKTHSSGSRESSKEPPGFVSLHDVFQSISHPSINDRRYLHITEKVKKQHGPLAKLLDLALANGWVKKQVEARRSYLQRLVQSKAFDYLCALTILVNSVLLGVSTDYAARHSIAEPRDMPLFFKTSDLIFSVWFIFELGIRVGAEGPLGYWSCFQSQWAWNYFDTLVVFMNVVEIVMENFSEGTGGANLTALRLLRVMRVARALRVVRLVGFFKQLRMMVLSVFASFTTLLWAIVLLLIVMFVFSIFMLQSVTSHLKDHDSETLRGFFDSLPASTYALFLAVSGGISWVEISDPLFEVGSTTGFLFCFYIFFTVFAMLNIITGIFLDTAMRSAQNDKDEVIQEQLAAEDSNLRMIQKFFADADQTGTGEITAEAFAHYMDQPRLRAHLAAIGIDAGEAEGLFRLLDLDSSGTITVEEFVFGCMRMKGTAKSIDIATLMYENKRMVDVWTNFMKYVEEQFKKVMGLLGEPASPAHGTPRKALASPKTTS